MHRPSVATSACGGAGCHAGWLSSRRWNKSWRHAAPPHAAYVLGALNTDYIFWRPHRDRNFVPIGGERQSVNQDAIVKLIGWAGNLTMSGSQFQGVLKA